MDLSTNEFDYNKIKKEGTGSHDFFEDYKIIDYPFDKYQIKIKLAPNNEFIGIIEIKINKDFLSHKQKIISSGYIDVDDLYRE
jgi:hypothetical protein